MMLTSTTVLLLTGTVLFMHDRISSRQSLARNLTTRSEILAANATASLAFENHDDARQLLAGLRSDPSTVRAVLYDKHGKQFAIYPADADPASVPTAPTGRGYRIERSLVIIVQPVAEAGRALGTLYLESDLRVLDERQRIFALVVLLAVAGSIVVAFILSTWLQRGVTEPVRKLVEAARSVSQSEQYSIRASVVSDDELGLLAEAFNEMLDAIQLRDTALSASEARLRQLNADLERRVHVRTAELEAANKELEAFSYSVSHDLRAPLRHIDGFADLLRRHAVAALDEKGQRYLAMISDSAKSMGVLIDDLLSFSRMGRSEMQHASVNLDELVAEVRAALGSEMAGRDIEWSVSALPEVVGDRAMLRQALVNLLSNAIKYTRGRAPARITVAATEGEQETVLLVRDNGAGFDMTYQHKLFGVFQRLHSAEDFEGTGIGLANVRRIVQRHGGRVWAEATLGEGATFFIALPKHGVARLQYEEAA